MTGRRSTSPRSRQPGRTTASPRAEEWIELADAALRGAGYRSTGPRAAVLDVVGRQACVLTAHEIADEVRDRGSRAAIATIYRTLEALEDVGLLQRLEVGGGSPARFEPAFPGGAHHHHHLVCKVCGRAYPFDDAGLERAIDSVAARLKHRVEGHEVVLSGTCRDCR